MKLPVMSYVLIVIGLAAIVFGFFYGSTTPLKSHEGKIEKTRITEMKIRQNTTGKNSHRDPYRIEKVLAIKTDKGEIYIREVYKEKWDELQEKSMLWKTVSITFEESSFMIKELQIEGKAIINDEIIAEFNSKMKYFFFAFGAMAFYMAWQFYNKKKIKSQRA